MSSVLDIANGVASLLEDYGAQVVFAPDISLEKGREMRIEVLPIGKERKFISRSAFENLDSVDVAVIHKCREQAAVPELIALVETVGTKILGARVGTSICIKSRWEPLYAVEELRSKGLFVSVIQASFKEMA